jgi:hypothetical protein
MGDYLGSGKGAVLHGVLFKFSGLVVVPLILGRDLDTSFWGGIS